LNQVSDKVLPQQETMLLSDQAKV